MSHAFVACKCRQAVLHELSRAMRLLHASAVKLCAMSFHEPCCCQAVLHEVSWSVWWGPAFQDRSPEPRAPSAYPPLLPCSLRLRGVCNTLGKSYTPQHTPSNSTSLAAVQCESEEYDWGQALPQLRLRSVTGWGPTMPPCHTLSSWTAGHPSWQPPGEGLCACEGPCACGSAAIVSQESDGLFSVVPERVLLKAGLLSWRLPGEGLSACRNALMVDLVGIDQINGSQI
eukprot:1161724-Pelagomonas_calceolata.AAC.5